MSRANKRSAVSGQRSAVSKNMFRRPASVNFKLPTDYYLPLWLYYQVITNPAYPTTWLVSPEVSPESV
jgi:hypothetical protein